MGSRRRSARVPLGPCASCPRPFGPKVHESLWCYGGWVLLGPCTVPGSLLALVRCPSPLWPLYGARVPFGPCTVPDSLVALVWCPIPFGAMVPESLWALVLCTSPFGAMVPECLWGL
jgi:hypothetical protein